MIFAELISICLSHILFYVRVYLNMRARLYARARIRARVRICMIEEVSAARAQTPGFSLQLPDSRLQILGTKARDARVQTPSLRPQIC